MEGRCRILLVAKLQSISKFAQLSQNPTMLLRLVCGFVPPSPLTLPSSSSSSSLHLHTDKLSSNNDFPPSRYFSSQWCCPEVADCVPWMFDGCTPACHTQTWSSPARRYRTQTAILKVSITSSLVSWLPTHTSTPFSPSLIPSHNHHHYPSSPQSLNNFRLVCAF